MLCGISIPKITLDLVLQGTPEPIIYNILSSSLGKIQLIIYLAFFNISTSFQLEKNLNINLP